MPNVIAKSYRETSIKSYLENPIISCTNFGCNITNELTIHFGIRATARPYKTYTNTHKLL